MEVLKNKASMQQLDNLHGQVAQALSDGLEDPKVLAMAIKFLKDNDVTADLIVSNEIVSLADSIKQIAEKESVSVSMSVEDMLKIADV